MSTQPRPDLRAAMEAGGCLAVARVLCVDYFDAPSLAQMNGADLLAALRSGAHEGEITWRQDYLLPADPARIVDGRTLIATENQGCWLATQLSDHEVQFGVSEGGQWQPLRELDLDEFLARMLVEAAVFGTNSYFTGTLEDEYVLDTLELLPELDIDEDTILPTVLADPGWFALEAGYTIYLPERFGAKGPPVLGVGHHWTSVDA